MHSLISLLYLNDQKIFIKEKVQLERFAAKKMTDLFSKSSYNLEIQIYKRSDWLRVSMYKNFTFSFFFFTPLKHMV